MGDLPPVHIAVDLMGSDGDPFDLLNGLIQVAQTRPEHVQFSAFASHAIADQVQLKVSSLPIRVVPCQDVIQMDDSPLHAVRRKKESTLMQGLFQLKDKKIDAFVSAGNTGALMVGACHHLPTLEGIIRPGLLAVLPTEKEPMAVIDVGSNVRCELKHMLQFACLGAAYQRCALGLKRPRVGILNIGSESQKGTDVQKALYEKLSKMDDSHFEFVGNIEGRDAYLGNVDVLVTDGFMGNVFLKTSEGVSLFIRHTLQKAFENRESELVQEICGHLERHFDYGEYPGAILCGIDGIVVKCHGDASGRTISHGLTGAIQLAQNGLITKIKEFLSVPGYQV